MAKTKDGMRLTLAEWRQCRNTVIYWLKTKLKPSQIVRLRYGDCFDLGGLLSVNSMWPGHIGRTKARYYVIPKHVQLAMKDVFWQTVLFEADRFLQPLISNRPGGKALTAGYVSKMKDKPW